MSCSTFRSTQRVAVCKPTVCPRPLAQALSVPRRPITDALRAPSALRLTQPLQLRSRGNRRAGGSAARCNASLTVREAATGVEFPLVRTFWEGEAQRNVGASVRQKKIAFLGVKVYAVALYVEAERAAKELGVRKRGGFFDDNRNEDYALALVDGAFNKALEIQLVRKVEGAQFAEAIAEALEPRMRLTGELSTLAKFKEFFEGRTLEKGTQIVLLWRVEGILEITLRSAADKPDYSRETPDLRIESSGMCRAMFEVYLGSNTVVPDAIPLWAEGTKKLLESEEVRRATRRGGSG